MCGIAGFIDFSGGSSSQVLLKIGDSLNHRGPNAKGEKLWVDDSVQIGLAHRRLSIIDLDKRANQPMTSFDGKFELVFNGEIYNFKEIRIRLEALGGNFETQSDTEVVLKAWQKWGIECVHHFIGMFAFAIYNKEEKTLYLVRDRAGVKPLYYYYKNGLFLFGSELKALMAHPNYEKSINIHSTSLFLKYGYYPEPHTVFNDCFKLKAGHSLEFDLKNKELKESQYWNILDFYSKPNYEKNEEGISEELEELLKKSFQYRMVSDVPVGVFLSGGYDSSAVVALLQKQNNKSLNTFTIGFEEESYNEANYAKEVANYLGTNHHEEYCSFETAKNIIPELSSIYDEPFGDSSAIPTILVSRLAKKSVSVSLSADGGDELFAGYGKYWTALKYSETLSAIPLKKLGAALLKGSSPIAKMLGNGFNFKRRYQRVNDLLSQGVYPFRAMDFSSQNLLDSEIDSLFVSAVKKPNSNFNSEIKTFKNLSSLNQLLAMDFKTYLPDDILTKVDRASMSVGLESREPMLEHNLVEFMAQVPDNLKTKNGVQKYLLKKIVHKHLPKEMMDRPKKGFSVPVKKWMKTDLRDLLEDTLNEKRTLEIGIFNWRKVKELKENYLSGKDEDFNPVWFLFTFYQWHAQWMK